MNKVGFHYYLIFAILIVIIIIILIFSRHGYINRKKTHNDLTLLRENVDSLQKEIDVLKKYIEDLKKNDFVIEKLAREKYKMMKPGEEKVKFKEQDKPEK